MPKVAELRVVSYTQDHKKRYRVVGPKLLGKPGQKEVRGPARKSKKEAESDLYDERKRLANLLAEIRELSAAKKLDATNALQLARPTGKSLEQLVLIATAHMEKVESQKTRTLYEAWRAAIDELTYERASDAHLGLTVDCEADILPIFRGTSTAAIAVTLLNFRWICEKCSP